MLRSAGYTPVGADKRIDMLSKQTSGGFTDAKTYQQAIDTIEEHAAKGIPMIWGVDREKIHAINANALTDHFIVFVEKIENWKDGKPGYRFYDPGTMYEEKGTSQENILWYNGAGRIEGYTKYLGEKVLYTVTEIRPTL